MSVSRAPFRLRSTCDACSSAKIKCDKKQPVCDRCRINAFTCSYSPSRRHGKYSWKKFSEHSMTPPSTVLAPEPVMDVDSGDGQAGSGSGNGCGGGEDATFLDFNALGHEIDINSHWTGLDLGVDLPSGSGTPNDIQVHDIIGTRANSFWNGPSSTPTPTAATPTAAAATTTTTITRTSSSVPERPQPRTAPYDCEAEAFTALHSLHSCTMLHTDHPGELKQTTTTRKRTSFGGVTDHMPPLDKVLYFNRAAINTLKDLLNTPCVPQPHIVLLYMTIASKILFWYRLVVSSQHQPKSRPHSPGSDSDNSSTGQPTPPKTSSNMSDRAVKPVSFQIGVFDLEDEDQKLLMKGVLLREVRKLQSVVDQMKRMGGENIRDDEYHDEHYVSNWFAVLGSKMQAEVQDTLRQIKEFGAGTARRDG